MKIMSKRRKAVLVLAAVAVALTPTAAIGASNVEEPPLEAGDVDADSYVVGSGDIALLDMAFLATKNDGEKAQGNFEGEDAFGFRFAGKITCLEFEGKDKAGFIVVADDTSTSFLLGEAQLVTAMDGGAGSTGSFNLQSVAADATDCAPGEATMKANRGNVTVVADNKGARGDR